ncbi:hypothetical protein ACF9IK_09295 [Kitasatospora hibisci]
MRIRDAGRAPCEHVAALVVANLHAVDERIAELTRTRVARQARGDGCRL